MQSPASPVPDTLQMKVLILRYDPQEDTLDIGAEGLSGVEFRGILAMAYDAVFTENTAEYETPED